MPEKPQVLLVEDDRDIVRGLGIRLRAAGYATLAAHDGRAGLAAAVERHPDAIVLDIRMPVMDGLTLLGELRQHEDTKAIPVVVLSANVAEKSKNKALELGARYFLEKPCDPNMLLRAIRSAIGKKPCSAETTASIDE